MEGVVIFAVAARAARMAFETVLCDMVEETQYQVSCILIFCIPERKNRNLPRSIKFVTWEFFV